MTWIKFALSLLSIYSIYYSVLLAVDLLKSRAGAKTPGALELSFPEPAQPVSPGQELSSGDIASPVIASGGRTLKEIYIMAQEEAIEILSKIDF